MGTVFLAKQQPLDREVAVKVLHQQMANDELALHRFQNEAQTISKLNHPNIVTLFDFGRTDEGSLYLAMELLKGPTVVDEIQRRGAFEPEEAYKIVRDVARALAAAHQQNIVHRDLKPENVMLAEAAGGDRMIKVLDFGLAKMAESDTRPGDPARPATEADVIMGTPGYMSPEQIHGMPLDGRADLYALGVIWWELLTGRQLFYGKSPIEVLMRHLEEKPPAPHHVRPGLRLPPDALALLGRLLEKDRDRRPADGEETATLLAALEQESWQVKTVAQVSPAQPAPAGEWDQAFSQLDSGGAARPAVGSKLPQPAAPEPGPATGPTTFDLGAADPASAPMPVAPGPPGSAPNPAAPGSSGLMSAVADGSSPFPASPPAPLSPPAGTAAHKPLPPANPMAAIGLGDEEVSQELPGTPGGLAFDPGNDAWKARPAALDKPKMAERLWTVQRGERREQNIPESTIKRMAKEGKLLPDDLLSLPGEPPRPAHTFPSLGVSAAASRPSSDDGSPQPRPTPATGPTRPVGARRKSRRPLVFAALALALIGGAAGLYVTQPELVKAGLDTALPWLGELGDTIADDIDATLSGGPSPVASLGAPEPGRDPKQRVADLVLEADKASAKETVAGDAAAVLALKKALLLDDQHLPAIGRLLVRLAQQADGPAALERMGAEQVLNASLTRDRDEPWLRRARAAMALAGHDLAAADVDLARLGEGGTEDLELVLLRARAQLERDQARHGPRRRTRPPRPPTAGSWAAARRPPEGRAQGSLRDPRARAAECRRWQAGARRGLADEVAGGGPRRRRGPPARRPPPHARR